MSGGSEPIGLETLLLEKQAEIDTLLEMHQIDVDNLIAKDAELAQLRQNEDFFDEVQKLKQRCYKLENYCKELHDLNLVLDTENQVLVGNRRSQSIVPIRVTE